MGVRGSGHRRIVRQGVARTPSAWIRWVAIAWILLLGGGARAQGTRELVVMIDEMNFASWDALEELAAEFEAKHPGVSVRLLDQQGAVGQQDKARFLLAGGLQLDVTRIDVTEFSAFLGEGALVDLQPYFEADRAAGRWDPDDYHRVLDGWRDRGGHLHGIPSTFTPYVIYANLDLLERRGIPVPDADWTWEDLRSACLRATVDEDGDGHPETYGISLTQWLQAVVPWIWQAGGDLLDETGTHSRMDEAAVERAFGFLRTLLHGDRVASFDASFANQFSQGLFQAGQCAFYGPVGYWETYRFKDIEDFRWDVLPTPRGERHATSIAMTGYVVPRTSAHPELAYRFIRELGGEKFQRTLARIGNGVPGLVSASTSVDFLKPDVPPIHESVFLDVLDHGRLMPPLSNWRKIESLIQAELSALLLADEVDIAAACASMASKTDAYLALERRRAERERVGAWTLPLVVALGSALALLGFVLLRGPRPGALGRREERAAGWMLGLWAVGFLAFFLGPALATAVLSLCEWSPLRPLTDARWVGTENFTRLLGDGTYRASLRATTVYALLSVPLGLVFALGLALLLRRASWFSGVARTVVYIPAIVSPVITAALWRALFDPERGSLNRLLSTVGIDGPAWLRDEVWVLPALALTSLWGVGAQMLVFLAALQSQDPAQLEAARIDGAGPWRRFWHVTLPSLTPVLLFNLVIGVITAFQLFAQPFLMTEGGPGDASRLLVLYLYESGFRHLDMGYASAQAWVLFALLGVLCGILLKSSKHWVHYASGGAGAGKGGA